MSWYLEDAEALKILLLPHGPFTTREAAQEVATEIGCGRPVFVKEEPEQPVKMLQEPQEMTLRRARKAEKFQ